MYEYNGDIRYGYGFNATGNAVLNTRRIHGDGGTATLTNGPETDWKVEQWQMLDIERKMTTR